MIKLLCAMLLITATGCSTRGSEYNIYVNRPMIPTFSDPIFKLKTALKKNRTNIIINIDSDGGVVLYFDRLRRMIIKNQDKITCKLDGMAASAAFMLLAACDNRIITDSSVLMFHKMISVDKFGNKYTEDSKAPKDASILDRFRIKKLASRLRLMNYKSKLYLIKRFGIKKEKLFDSYINSEYYMTKDEFLNLLRK